MWTHYMTKDYKTLRFFISKDNLEQIIEEHIIPDIEQGQTKISLISLMWNYVKPMQQMLESKGYKVIVDTTNYFNIRREIVYNIIGKE